MTDLGSRFVAALAVKDTDRLVALFAADVIFRGMTPGRFWEADSPHRVVHEALYQWFELEDVIENIGRAWPRGRSRTRRLSLPCAQCRWAVQCAMPMGRSSSSSGPTSMLATTAALPGCTLFAPDISRTWIRQSRRGVVCRARVQPCRCLLRMSRPVPCTAEPQLPGRRERPG